MGGGNALAKRVDAAFDLRDHPLADRAASDEPARACGFQDRNQLAVFILHPFNVRKQNEFFGTQRTGDFAGGDIGVDIVGETVPSVADRRNYRDEAGFLERAKHGGIDFRDLADEPDINRGWSPVLILHDHPHLARNDQVAVLAREPDRASTLARDEPDNIFVDSLEHHLGRFHRLGVCHPHPTHEMRLETELADKFGDLRAAAVDDDRVDADGFAVEALNVGQRLDQDLGSFDHWMERGSEDRHSALKNVTGQVFILHNRVEPLMNVGGVDRDLLLGKLGRAERKVLEQPFKYSMETASADVFRAGVYLRGDFGQRGDGVVGEVDVDLLGLE